MTSILRSSADDEAGNSRGEKNGSAPKARRRRPHPVLLTLNIVLGMLVLVAGVALTYGLIQNSRLKRLDLERGGEGATLRETVKGQPINVLVVGSDSRAFAKTKEEQKKFGTQGEVGGQRSDTMMVVRLDPKSEKAVILSIPRDLYVDLEGGGRGRINEAFASAKDIQKADPNRLIRTINKNLGIPINHYMEVDFQGFRDVVNAIGGVNVYFPFPSRDKLSGLAVQSPGCIKLDGEQSLAYVRSRHFEFNENGRWKTDPTGDIGRIQRQQDFIRRVLSKAVGEGLLNPIRSIRLIEAGIDNVRVDDGLSISKMKSLAGEMKDLTEGNVTYLSIPVVPAKIGGADVLRVQESEADAVLAFMGATPAGSAGTANTSTAATTAPGNVQVLLSPTKSVDADAAGQLRAAGFQVTVASVRSSSTALTEIHYRSGDDTKARTVLGALAGGGELRVDREVPADQIVVYVGRDWRGTKSANGGTNGGTGAGEQAAPPPPTTIPPKGSDPSVTCR